MATINFFNDRMLAALLGGKTSNTKITPITPVSSTPTTPLGALDRLGKTGLSIYQQYLEKQKEEAGRAEAFDMLKAYNATGGQPAYDAVVNGPMDIDETDVDLDREAEVARNQRGGISALSEPTTRGGENMQMALMMGDMQQRQATEAAELKQGQARDNYLFEQSNKSYPPQKQAATYSSVFSDDGTRVVAQKNNLTGKIEKDPTVPKRHLVIPGLGVMDLTTNKIITPQNASLLPSDSPQNSQTPPASSIPAAPPSNFAGLSAKGKEDLKQKEYEQATQEIRKRREGLGEAKNLSNSATRFSTLLEQQPTGGALRQLPGSGTIEGTFSPAIREMNSIVDRITPLMRQGLPGAASERDTKMFRGAAFGTDKDSQTNKNLILGLQMHYQTNAQQVEFLEAYVSAHGHLRGSTIAWREYLEANPIYDTQSTPQILQLNPSRQSWKEHFKKGAGGNSVKEPTIEEINAEIARRKR
jgi:hypothetical protein